MSYALGKAGVELDADKSVTMLIARARETASVFEDRGDDVPMADTAFYTGRATALLRALCSELEAERKRRLSTKDDRWK